MGLEISSSKIEQNNSNIKITKDNVIKDKVIVLLGNERSQKNSFINLFINGKIFEEKKK